MLTWLGALTQLGATGPAVVDTAAAARWLGRAFNIPAELMVSADIPPTPQEVPHVVP